MHFKKKSNVYIRYDRNIFFRMSCKYRTEVKKKKLCIHTIFTNSYLIKLKIFAILHVSIYVMILIHVQWYRKEFLYMYFYSWALKINHYSMVKKDG